MRVLFTGIPGLNMSGHLDALVRFLQDSGGDIGRIPVMKAESFLLTEVENQERRFLPPGFHGLSHAKQMIYVLGFPKPFLRECWRAAVTTVLRSDDNKDAKHAFLHMHAAFHHQCTREFFCPADVKVLAEWKPDMIVTLLDDIDDCVRRLMRKGQMFSGEMQNYHGLGGPTRAINNMALLYDWRAVDILAAERLAGDLGGIPHFCMSVKHPASTFVSLIFRRNCPVYYLSHPISEPRRQLLAGEESAFQEFGDHLETCCGRLRRACTLVEPTCIDEFRLQSFTAVTESSRRTYYLPSYTRRWRLPEGTLWVKPSVAMDNPLDPGDFFSSNDLSSFEQCKKTDTPGGEDCCKSTVLEATATQLDSLIGNTGDQIGSRDHKLVEQSSGLVVFRPLYRGNASGGVEKEIEYHCRLRLIEGDTRRRRIWIYTHEDDEARYILGTWVPSHFHELFSGRRATHTQGDDREATAIVAEVSLGLIDSWTAGQDVFLDDLFSALAERDIRLLGPHRSLLAGKEENAQIQGQLDFSASLNHARPPYVEFLEAYGVIDSPDCVIARGPGTSMEQFLDKVISGQ